MEHQFCNDFFVRNHQVWLCLIKSLTKYKPLRRSKKILSYTHKVYWTQTQKLPRDVHVPQRHTLWSHDITPPKILSFFFHSFLHCNSDTAKSPHLCVDTQAQAETCGETFKCQARVYEPRDEGYINRVWKHCL